MKTMLRNHPPKLALIIKAESLPARCEVCHQTDCFEPETGTCSRCQDVIQPATVQAVSLTSPRPAISTTFVGILSGVIFLTIWWGYLFWTAKPGRPDLEDSLAALAIILIFGSLAGLFADVVVSQVMDTVTVLLAKKCPESVRTLATAAATPLCLVAVWVMVWCVVYFL
ncbi:MAG: hypothetical protein K1Y36_06260 [Blastocatellia bacterium]|nr:hypothetical protein [Blastocatellia bacterium]